MTEPAYQVRGLHAGYPETPVLIDVSLDVEPGLLHGVVGPNGCGKTTLLNVLAGLFRPASGTVRLLGRNLADSPRDALARTVALAPQEPEPNFPFTVRDAVLMGRHPYIPRFAGPSDQDLALAALAMETAEITHLAHRPLSCLSGGEKQRTTLARVLAQDTPALLLDEPTANMDVRHALRTMAELRRLAGAGKAVVAVLHDQNLAAAFCRRITILHQGTVFATGPTAEILTPDVLATVFGVEAQVTPNQFTGGLTIAFREKP